LATIQTEEILNQPEEDKEFLINTKKKLLWVIAKNEVKLRTYMFRNHRTLFFIGSYLILGIWAFFIAPLIFDLFMPTLATQYSEIFKPVIALLIESFMMGIFITLVIFPLNNIYRKSEIGFKESLLASPITSRDIFFGEYFGKFPIYTFAILIFAPILVGMINPLINLNLIQYIVIYSCSFGLVYFANLIGTILASWLEHKISKSEKARDFGNLIIWILTIVLIIIMYSVIFFMNELLSNPELKNWVMFYPSFWFSNIILFIIDPTLLSSYILNIWMSLLLAIFIPSIIIFLSYKNAEKFYTLEGISSGKKSRIRQENKTLEFIRPLIGSRWGGLVIVQLKRFFRKKANIARIIYVIGLIGFIGWFSSSWNEDFEGILIGSTMLIALGGAMVSILIAQLIFIDSKNIIWVYKKSPRGIRGLIFSYLLVMLIINVFIALFISIFRAIISPYNLIWTISFFFLFLTNMELGMIQGIGLQCMNPAFGEKDANMKANSMISMVIQQPVLLVPIFLLIFINPSTIFGTIIVTMVPLFLYNLFSAVVLLYIGLKRLNKLE
jgi:hypothetical protein